MGNGSPGRGGAHKRRLSGPSTAATHPGGWVIDPWIVAAAAVLVGLGLLNLLALGMAEHAVRHGVIGAAGLVAMVLLARLRVQALSRLAWAVYLAAVLMLLAVPLVGDKVKGAQRWLDLGVISVQPSEVAKLGVLLLLVHQLARGYSWWRLWSALAFAAVPVGLVATQPDLSTAAVIASLVLFTVVLARVPLLPLLPIFGIALASLPLVLLVLRPYQLDRLESFASGARDASGAGWAALQAEIAIAAGGLFGRAGDPLFDLRASYVPESEHDLAFASVVHAWGLLAGVAVIAAVLVLVWRAALASRMTRSPEAALIAAGVAAMFGLHAFVSIAANLTLLPHTGLPIPLFSYGGTTATVHFVALGLVLAARRDGLDRPLWAPAPPKRRHPRWARTGAVLLSATLAAMSWFAWHVQSARGDELRQTSEEQMTRCIRLPAERGDIRDRTGEPLATNQERSEVHVVPGLFPEGDSDAIARLAGIVDEPAGELADAVEQVSESSELHVEIATVRPEVGDRLAESELPGVLVMPSQRRDYPLGSVLGPTLGFVGVGTPADMSRQPSLALGSVVGRAGLEQQYDAILRGTDGWQCVYVEPDGRPAAAAGRTDPVPGEHLRLHLDAEMQRVANEALADAIEESGGDLGGAVAMDARTGAVLAKASVPAYDNNVYVPPINDAELASEMDGSGLPMIDHVSQVPVAPGSTFKIVVAAANAVYDAVPPDRVVPTGASFSLGGHTFDNWRPMGPHDLVDAIAMSDNVYFYKLALELGPEKIATVAEELGVGRPTGIDLPGENAGFLGTPDSVQQVGGNWYTGSTVLMGIGQGPLTVTPLHSALWTSGLATGHIVTPQLAAAFGNESFTELETEEPRELSFADKLDPVLEGMRASAERGTAGQLNELPISSVAKTGTAEDPSSPNGEPHAWFSAVAPAEEPEIVVSTFVRGGGFGSQTSGPVVTAILEHYIDNR
ncbi:penicillin-binding protein 2 [Haloechinothrix alba]|uniref:Penicillin-binding protein 2 n=2 Tax=Haloechinothrix alba TaxID=664784 RepID=A0A238X1H1_9PSEU|nr:penicillin-binding protein 2 [Haloechinothrix alba]